MSCQTAKPPSQTNTRSTKRVNVTDMTPNQLQELLRDYMNQNGFIGFTKTKDRQNKQTYYIFTYDN